MTKFPILYDQNETDFSTLGLGPIYTSIKATVTEERNGSFYFEGEVLVDDQVFPLLDTDKIIRADAGHLLKDQRFRIKRIVPKHDNKATIYAEHVSYLSRELSLQPEVYVSGSGAAALATWKNALVDSNPFVVDSDITTTAQTAWKIKDVKNAREALGGVEGSILDRWGGEYRFDNYHISLLQKRGSAAETLLAYGRNITDFEQEKNITDTYNSIYPYAVYTDDQQQEQLITIPGLFVDVTNINNFPNRKALPVDFSGEFAQDEVPTTARLIELSNQYIQENQIGIPKVSIKVSFIDLSKTVDYQAFAPLEQVNLCDDVLVKYPKLGVDTTAKVIRTAWNVLAETYNEIEIGEKRLSLSSIVNDAVSNADKATNQANDALTAANGKNTIFYGLFGEDGLGEPRATAVGDGWYKPIGNGEYEFYQWDGTVWQFIMTTAPNQDLLDAIDEAQKEAEQALENANQAVDKATDAHNEALLASEKAQDAMDELLLFENETDGNFALIQGSIDGLNVTVANKADKSELTILSNQITAIVTDVENNSAELVLLSDQITSIVRNGSVVNSLSNGGFLEGRGEWTVLGAAELVLSRLQGENPDITSNAMIIRAKDTTTTLNGMTSPFIRLNKDNPVYSVSFEITFKDIVPATGSFNVDIVGYTSAGVSRGEFGDLTLSRNTVAGSYGQTQLLKLENVTIPTDTDVEKIAVRISFTKDGYAVVRRVMVSNHRTVGPFTQDTASLSQITQLADQINLRVEKGDVVNQINIGGEGILIAANKIQITGETYIEDASIDGAKIKNIIANTITTGVLNAAAVTIINLNAANITTGFLNTSRIQAGSITTDKLETNFIAIGFNNYTNTLQLTPTALEFYLGNVRSGRLTSEGMEFWYGSNAIGRIGENSVPGAETYRGISTNLERYGRYIMWSYKVNSSDTWYTPMLTLDPAGNYSGRKGLTADVDFYAHGDFLAVRKLRTVAYSPTTEILLTTRTISNDYFCMIGASASNGIAFGASTVYLLINNTAYDFKDIRDVVNIFKVMGTFAIPRSIRSDGTVTSWSNFDI